MSLIFFLFLSDHEDVPPGAVSAKRVYQWMKQPDVKLLLIDLRPADQFNDSRVSDAACINIPAEIIQPGCVHQFCSILKKLEIIAS